MMFASEVVDAEMAKQYGIVLEVYPSTGLLDAAKALSQRIAGCSMQSVAAIKRVTRLKKKRFPCCLEQSSKASCTLF
jgi:enoyl-CoA hydratase/carnithine racemase